MTIDLTPFGFTPTENLAYRALLDEGPIGGYAFAKKLNIARANASALIDLALRTAARADSPVIGVGPASLLAALAPAWRRREADGRETAIWRIEDGTDRLPIDVRGNVDRARCRELFGADGFFLLTSDLAIAA